MLTSFNQYHFSTHISSLPFKGHGRIGVSVWVLRTIVYVVYYWNWLRSFSPDLLTFSEKKSHQVNYMKNTKRKQPLRIRNDSYKHWIVKSVFIYELERLGHEVEIEVYLPGVGYCDLVDRTTWIQYRDRW